MVNKRERQILNEAATTASRGSYQVREADVNHLESLREEIGLNMREVDSMLGKSNNWYSTHRQTGGTHEFTRPDFCRLRDMLEVEYLRNLVGFSENRVSNAVNHSRGWYEEQIQQGFKNNDYNEVVVFLVTAAVLQNKVEILADAAIEEIVKLGMVSQEFVDDLHDTVDIDYGH